MQPARLAAVLERPLEGYSQTQLARAHASFFTFVTQRLPLAVAGNTRSREQVWRQSYPDDVENHARSTTNDGAIYTKAALVLEGEGSEFAKT